MYFCVFILLYFTEKKIRLPKACPRLSLGEGALGGALGEALGGPWAVSLGRWSWTCLGRALGASLASALIFSENEQPLRALGKALGAALGGAKMRPGAAERHPRSPKNVKFSGHYLPWAGTLGGPRLPKAHSRRSGSISPRLLTKAFDRQKTWAALGGPRQTSGKALGGLGRFFCC